MQKSEFEQFHDGYRELRGLVTTEAGNPLSNENFMLLSNEIGRGRFTTQKLQPGLRYCTSDWQVHTRRTERHISNAPVIELNVCSQGVTESLVNGSSLSILPEQITLSFIKTLEVETLFTPDQHYRSSSITMTSSMFDSYMGMHGEGHSELNYAHFLGTDHFKSYQGQMNADMNKIIGQMQQCRYHGALQNLYMEGKVMELFSMFMHDLVTRKQKTGLRKGDIERLKQAKSILLDRMDKPPTLLELAQIVGINDFKLKRGFKELFGNTVFGVLREARMERALELLREGKWNVSQVAWTIGYSNLSHFSTAFRQKYGMNPSDWMRVYE
ncbi:helix-turn-helix transcriptional regulator [Paenibacillus sp. strain BS8-2]